MWGIAKYKISLKHFQRPISLSEINIIIVLVSSAHYLKFAYLLVYFKLFCVHILLFPNLNLSTGSKWMCLLFLFQSLPQHSPGHMKGA